MDPYQSQTVHEDEYGYAVQPWEGEQIYSDEKGEYFTRDGAEYFRPWNYDLWWVYRKGGLPREAQHQSGYQYDSGYQHNSGYQQHSSYQQQSGYQTQEGYQQLQGYQHSSTAKQQRSHGNQAYQSNRSARKAPSSGQDAVKFPPLPPRPSHLREKRVLKNLSESARKKHLKSIARAEKEGRQLPSSRTFSWKDQATKEEIAYYDHETKYQWHVVNAAAGARQRELNVQPQRQEFRYNEEDEEEEEEEEPQAEAQAEEGENDEDSTHVAPRPKHVREMRVLKVLCERARTKHNRSIERAVRNGLEPPLPRTFAWRDYATTEEIEYYTGLTHSNWARSAEIQRATRHEPQQIYESGSFVTEKFPTPPPPPPMNENCRRVRKVNIASSLGTEHSGRPPMIDRFGWKAEANDEERLFYDYEERFV